MIITTLLLPLGHIPFMGLTGDWDGGCHKRGESKEPTPETEKEEFADGGGQRWRRRFEGGRVAGGWRRQKEEGVCGGPAHQDTPRLHRCAAPPSRPTRLEASRTRNRHLYVANPMRDMGRGPSTRVHCFFSAVFLAFLGFFSFPCWFSRFPFWRFSKLFSTEK
jgi:hypothetical protein